MNKHVLNVRYVKFTVKMFKEIEINNRQELASESLPSRRDGQIDTQVCTRTHAYTRTQLLPHVPIIYNTVQYNLLGKERKDS